MPLISQYSMRRIVPSLNTAKILNLILLIYYLNEPNSVKITKRKRSNMHMKYLTNDSDAGNEN